MGFPIKSEPKTPETSEEKLVNVEKISDLEKTEPVGTTITDSVNADVDKSQLGPKKVEVFNSKFGPGVAVPNATLASPEGVKTGASINNASVQPKIHNVVVTDHTKDDHRKYDFKVHCNTCGWEGRYNNKQRAEAVALNHKNAKSAA